MGGVARRCVYVSVCIHVCVCVSVCISARLMPPRACMWVDGWVDGWVDRCVCVII